MKKRLLQETTIDDSQQLANFFPFPEPRPEQSEAWRFIVENASQKNTLVLELPTGIGKSPLAVATAQGWSAVDTSYRDENLQSGAYILTTQKILQQQYVNDFGHDPINVNSVWSKQSYSCECHPGLSCHVGKAYARYHPETEAGQHCKTRCPYTRDARAFFEGRISVTNTPFFLNQATYNAKQVKKRELLIVDEAHNLEEALVSFIGFDVTKASLRDLDITWPKFKVTSDRKISISQLIMWIDKTYEPAFAKALASLGKQVEQAVAKKEEKKAMKLVKRWTRWDSELCSLRRFQEGFQIDNWVVNCLPDRYELRPIDVSTWGRDSLFTFARKAVLMSATILDTDVYASSLGLKANEVACFSTESPFQVEQRPIYYAPVGSMSMKNIDASLPELAKRVQHIIDHYQDFKGIVHCHSYKILDYLVKNLDCKDSKGRSRILSHQADNRTQIYEAHLEEDDRPTVLLSPSMSEGVDLKDELSRFQVICKVPFPYLGDQRVRVKFDRDKRWYDCMTARTLVQQTGRSIRSADDWAHSFILDSDFEGFVKRSGSMLPKWWLTAVQVVQP